MNLESLPLIIYVVDLLTARDGIIVVTLLLGVGYIIFFILSIIPVDESDIEKIILVKKRAHYNVIRNLFFSLVIFLTLTPSKEGAYKILAAYYGVQALDTEFVGELSNTSKKALSALNHILDEYAEKDEK